MDQFQIGNEFVDQFHSAFEIDAEHAAVSITFKLLVCQSLAGRRIQARIIDFFYFRMVFKELCQSQAVLAHLLDAQRQCPQTACQEPRFRRTQIAAVQAEIEADRIDQFFRSQRRAAYDIVMAAQVFRRAVQNEVGAEFCRLGHDGRSKSVVDKEQGAVVMGHVCQMPQIRDGHERIGNGFPVNNFRIGLDVVFRFLCIEIDERRFDAPLGKFMF